MSCVPGTDARGRFFRDTGVPGRHGQGSSGAVARRERIVRNVGMSQLVNEAGESLVN